MVALRREQTQPRTSVQASETDHESKPEERQDESDTQQFVGFKKGNGYTQVNNAILNQIMGISNAAELRIVLYVYRHTEGWNQPEVAISIQEFRTGRLNRSGEPLDDGTRLCERSVKSAIQRAIKDGYIERRQVGNLVYFKLRMQKARTEEEAEHDQETEPGRDRDQSQQSHDRPGREVVTPGQPSQPAQRSATTGTDQPKGVQNLHPSTPAKGVQNLHATRGKTCTPSDKTCTPSVQNLHPLEAANPPQERPQAQPKEKRKTNYYKDREKEKDASLSLSSNNTSLRQQEPGGRVQRSSEVPQTAKYAEIPVTEEERQQLQERLAKLRLDRERREAAELESVRLYA